jgi:hypothetical protein
MLIFLENLLLWACWELLQSACRHSRKVTMNADCTVTKHFSCITDTVMCDPSPIVQVSGLMFLGYRIVSVSSTPGYPAVLTSLGMLIILMCRFCIYSVHWL